MGKQMMASIAEQPRIWRDILNRREALCERALRLWAGRRRVLIVGSGSSRNAALCTQHFYEDALGIETAVVSSTGVAAPAALMNPDDTVVLAVSQSGRSTNTEAAIALLAAKGFAVVAITADAASAVAKAGDAHVLIACGTETVPAKTKGMTASVLTLYMLGLLAAVRQKRIDAVEAQRLVAFCQAAADHAEENIRRSVAFCEQHMAALATQPHYTLIADGAGLPAAGEGALKLLETLYAPASAYEFEEYLHGVNNTMVRERAHFYLPTHTENLARISALLAYSDRLGCRNWQVSALPVAADERTLTLLGSGSPHTVTFETLLFFQVLSSLGSDHLGHDCDHPRWTDFYSIMGTKSIARGE